MTDEHVLEEKFEKSCILCGIRFKNVKVLETHLLTHPEYVETVTLSDNMNDYCKTKCKICGELSTLASLRHHVRLKHAIKITDYKKVYGLLDIVEKFHHKCKLCERIVLLDADDIKNHLQHKHKDTQVLVYNKMYMSSTMRKKQNFKSTDPDLDHQLIYDLLENNDIGTEEHSEDFNAQMFSIAYDEIFDS